MNITELQLDAYNEKNLDAFLNYYSDDYKAYMLETGQLITENKDHLHKIMSGMFETNKFAHSKVIESMKQGDLYVNREESVGHIPDKIITSITIYEVKDGKITQMWFGGRTIT